MVRLYGNYFKREDLLRRIGSIDQVGGIKITELSSGFERGVRVAIIRTGELSFLVALDRGMDIVNAEYRGIPLGWISPTGIIAPSFYEPEGLGWLRGFPGGLLTTCGLTYMGAPTIDNGEHLGLHGRVSYAPANLVRADGFWENDDYEMILEGEVKESKVFEPNLTLRRSIKTKLGGYIISIHDKITNQGWQPQPLMLLYHINIGFPVVDEKSKFISTTHLFVPRDREALDDAENFAEIHLPRSGYKEKVYFHDMLTDSEGNVQSAIVNKSLLEGLGIYVKYSKHELPRFTEWKMMGEGTYVVGMEPANGLVLGRDKERAWRTLQYIKPQETKDFHLELGILVGEEIKYFEEKVDRITRGVRPEMVRTVEEFIDNTRASSL